MSDAQFWCLCARGALPAPPDVARESRSFVRAVDHLRTYVQAARASGGDTSFALRTYVHTYMNPLRITYMNLRRINSPITLHSLPSPELILSLFLPG